jgi:hypothetical protein
MKLIISISDTIQWFDIDPTKIDVFYMHRLFQYDEEGNETITDTRYETRKCTESDFNET